MENSSSLSIRCIQSLRGSHGKLAVPLHIIFSNQMRCSSLCHTKLSSLQICRSSPPSAVELPPAFVEAMPSSPTKLPHGLHPHLLPRHVAIIMDGNSRWAERRGLSRSAGHEAGAESLKRVLQLSSEWGLEALTVFAFSTENWQRGQVEVSILMQLFQRALTEELATFVEGNVQVRFIGDIQRFPLPLQFLIQKLQQRTAHNTGLKFTVAASYSGRYDIIQACQRVAANVQQGKLNPEDITEHDLEEQLGTSWIGDVRNPDLLIRTSGERRLSNFLLWQLAYTELFFMDVMWPDVDEVHYAEALLSFQTRHRRYGTHVSNP